MSTDLANKPERKKSRGVRLTKKGKAVIIGGISAAAVLGILLVFLAFVPADKIPKGVYVGDLDLSGMTQEAAEEAVNRHTFGTGKKELSVKANGKTAKIEFDRIDLTVDAQTIAQNAFDICHTGNKAADMLQAAALKFSKKQLPVVHKADTLKLDTVLAEFGESIYGKLVQHEVKVSDMSDKVIIIPGNSGCSTNFEKARNEILESVSKLEFDDIAITLEREKPKEIDAKTIADTIYRSPKDAEYSVADGDVSIVPHVVGIELDANDAADKIKSVTEGGSEVEINVIKSMPMITTSDLEAKLFNTTLGSYTTKYNPNAVNRSKNVAVAANKINGYVIAPGAEFSYNDVVGKRTAANGFFNAPVYENGKSVDGIGGGVCQVSTTLYSAVLYSDLEIVSRRNHSMPVSYVPLGQDATVVDGSIDFKFKNNTNYPVKITASASGGKMSVSIQGTKRDVDRTVKLEHVKLSEIPPTSKETQAADLPLGTRVVTSKGKTGYVIKSTKHVYENGVLVESKSLGKSTYKMVPEEVSVGTGAAVAQTPAPAAAAAADVPVQAE